MLVKQLSGGDLLSVGNSNSIATLIKTQKDFNLLVECLSHKDRVIVMRSVDAIEKITISNPLFLAKHKKK